MTTEDFKNVADSTLRFAELAIKYAIILNGTAAISIFTFIGHTGSKASNFKSPIIILSIGTLLAAMSAGAGYIAQHAYSQTMMEVPEKERVLPKWHGSAYQWVGIILIIVSYAFFATGVILATSALS